MLQSLLLEFHLSNLLYLQYHRKVLCSCCSFFGASFLIFDLIPSIELCRSRRVLVRGRTWLCQWCLQWERNKFVDSRILVQSSHLINEYETIWWCNLAYWSKVVTWLLPLPKKRIPEEWYVEFSSTWSFSIIFLASKEVLKIGSYRPKLSFECCSHCEAKIFDFFFPEIMMLQSKFEQHKKKIQQLRAYRKLCIYFQVEIHCNQWFCGLNSKPKFWHVLTLLVAQIIVINYL